MVRMEPRTDDEEGGHSRVGRAYSIVQRVGRLSRYLPDAPWASYKVGLRKPFMWGSALLLAFASWSAIYIPAPLGWPLMVLVGIATSGTFAMILALPLELLPNEYAGMASGTVLSIGYVGGLVGPWLAGRIVDVTGSFDLALYILTGTAIVWALIGFLIPETGRRASPDVRPA